MVRREWLIFSKVVLLIFLYLCSQNNSNRNLS
nr:MAG TPA: hypothetical protein [Caudoviricetes sp.]